MKLYTYILHPHNTDESEDNLAASLIARRRYELWRYLRCYLDYGKVLRAISILRLRHSLTCRYVVVCFRGDAQIYSGAAEHVASAALHKSAVRGVQELREVNHITKRIHITRVALGRSVHAFHSKTTEEGQKIRLRSAQLVKVSAD